MKKVLIFPTILLVTALFSCAPPVRTFTTRSMELQGSRISSVPLLVDLLVDSVKVTGAATARASRSVELIKRDAVENALLKMKGDLLVEPQFETLLDKGIMTVTVMGFPARYKSFRKATLADTIILKYNAY